MIVVGDLVGDIGQLRLQPGLLPPQKTLAQFAQFARLRYRAVLEDPLATFKGQVQAREQRIAFLELIYRAH